MIYPLVFTILFKSTCKEKSTFHSTTALNLGTSSWVYGMAMPKWSGCWCESSGSVRTWSFEITLNRLWGISCQQNKPPAAHVPMFYYLSWPYGCFEEGQWVHLSCMFRSASSKLLNIVIQLVSHPLLREIWDEEGLEPIVFVHLSSNLSSESEHAQKWG